MGKNKIELTPITPQNYNAGILLKFRPDQEKLVASVEKSLADANLVSIFSKIRKIFHDALIA